MFCVLTVRCPLIFPLDEFVVEGLNGFAGGSYADSYVLQAVFLDFEIPFVVCQRALFENVLQAGRFAAKRRFSLRCYLEGFFSLDFYEPVYDFDTGPAVMIGALPFGHFQACLVGFSVGIDFPEPLAVLFVNDVLLDIFPDILSDVEIFLFAGELVSVQKADYGLGLDPPVLFGITDAGGPGFVEHTGFIVEAVLIYGLGQFEGHSADFFDSFLVIEDFSVPVKQPACLDVVAE